ncbi:hypothetical protein D9M68_833490 [compost metagenome]|nr:hypothetical protein N184_33480 [Sinorhizobium sp. GL28]
MLDGRRAFKNGQCLRAIACPKDFVVKLFQPRDGDATNALVIFHDQNEFAIALGQSRSCLTFRCLIALVGDQGKVDPHGRSLSDLAVQRDVPAGLLHKSIDRA